MVFKKKYLEDIELSKRYDLDVRKHLHVKLFTETKKELHIQALRLGMTVTKMFERLARAIIEEDPYIIKMLNQYRIDLENEEIVHLSRTDADSIYKAIEESEARAKVNK